MLFALFCIFIVIKGEPCNQTYPGTKIEYITTHFNDANSRSDVYNIYYLGNKQSATECLNDCVDFNYLCDKSLNNTYVNFEPSGSASWDFDNSLCSITMLIDKEAEEAFALLTPNITANEYIIDIEVSLPTGSRDAGIIFKANEWESACCWYSYVAYINAVDNVVTCWWLNDPTDGEVYDIYDVALDKGVTIDWNVIYNFQVHVAYNKYTLSLNGQEVRPQTAFLPEYAGVGYAGIYIQDTGNPTTATFHSFKVKYPDPNDNDDEFVCAAYVYNNINGDCYGYYGNDINAITNSMSADITYESGILYDSCPTTLYPTHSPSKAPTKSPSERPTKQPGKNPSESLSEYPTEAPTKHPTVPPSESPIPTADNIIASLPTTKDLTPSIHSINDIISTTNEKKDNNSKNAHKPLGTWWLWLIVITLAVAVIISALYVFGLIRKQSAVELVKKTEAHAAPDVIEVRSKLDENVDKDFKNVQHLTTDNGFGTTTCTETKRQPDDNEVELEGVNVNEMIDHEPKSFSEGPDQVNPQRACIEATSSTKGVVETNNMDIEMIVNENIQEDEFIVCEDDEVHVNNTETIGNLAGRCVDCTSWKNGKMFDGVFYCNQCYAKYYL